jgi:hypothetical protein
MNKDDEIIKELIEGTVEVPSGGMTRNRAQREASHVSSRLRAFITDADQYLSIALRDQLKRAADSLVDFSNAGQ